MKNYSTDIANKQELDEVKEILKHHHRRLNMLTWSVIGFAASAGILQAVLVLIYTGTIR